jgi:hypothetical protein
MANFKQFDHKTPKIKSLVYIAGNMLKLTRGEMRFENFPVEKAPDPLLKERG